MVEEDVFECDKCYKDIQRKIMMNEIEVRGEIIVNTVNQEWNNGE